MPPGSPKAFWHGANRRGQPLSTFMPAPLGRYGSSPTHFQALTGGRPFLIGGFRLRPGEGGPLSLRRRIAGILN